MRRGYRILLYLYVYIYTMGGDFLYDFASGKDVVIHLLCVGTDGAVSTVWSV